MAKLPPKPRVHSSYQHSHKELPELIESNRSGRYTYDRSLKQLTPRKANSVKSSAHLDTNSVDLAQVEKIREEKYKHYDDLVETCDRHPAERVRYYCRDCLMGLCSEDVVEHAKHDFILADNSAAVQIRKTMILAEQNIRDTAQSYETILCTTQRKLAEIEVYKQQELKRIEKVFQEIREAIFQRESAIRKDLLDRINHAQ